MATVSNSTCGESEKTNQTPPCRVPTEDSRPLPNLPRDIAVEILSRLPVKSLLRLRCVCKPWRSLISSPKFAKAHLSLASTNTDFTHDRLLLISLSPDYDVVMSCSLYDALHKHFDTAVELDFPFKVPHRLIRNKGCCDGLVCVAVGRKVSLWNPSTRKFVTLPDAGMPYHYGEMYGFGYDESIDDYKVVRFFSSTRCREVQVKIYTLRSDSWRRIGEFPHCGFPEGLGTFVNGSLRWIVVNETYNIVSLDLAKETYGEVLQPEYRDDYLHDITLDILNGCLCIVSYHNSCTDVWVMKEYGIRESWTKLCVVPCVPHPTDRLWILKNGEVLLHIQDRLVRYSPKDSTFNHLTVYNFPWFFGQYPYVESLVSPHVDADSGVKWQHQY